MAAPFFRSYSRDNRQMKFAWLFSAAAILAGIAGWSTEGAPRHLALRSRVELFRGSGQWSEVQLDYAFDPARSALIVCDMWDKHWCSGANVRVAELVKKLEPVLELARRKGMVIVHAPSDTMDFYANMRQRKRMTALTSFTPPKELDLTAPPLPIDDSDGGCDTPGDKRAQGLEVRAGRFEDRARRLHL